MSYNETQIRPTYDIVGRFSMPYLSYGNNTAEYKGEIETLFFDTIDRPDNRMPNMIPGKTAFYISFTSSKKGVISRVILAVVDTVTTYLAWADGTCNLKFTYTEVPMETYDPGLTVISPNISHLFIDHDFAAVVMEGDPDFIIDHINKNMRTFAHGGKTYWLIDTFQYTMHLRSGEASIDTERPTVAIIAVASTLKVANKANYEEFQVILNNYLSCIYGQGK